jgi:hypothetical protein
MTEQHWSGGGTPDDPWMLKTAPLSSDYTLYRDDDSDPALLVCQVGTTRLTYLARAIEDLHAELLRRGDWVALGAADEKKEPAPDSVEAWGRSEDNPSAAGTGSGKAIAAASACTCRRCWRPWVSSNSSTTRATIA